MKKRLAWLLILSLALSAFAFGCSKEKNEAPEDKTEASDSKKDPTSDSANKPTDSAADQAKPSDQPTVGSGNSSSSTGAPSSQPGNSSSSSGSSSSSSGAQTPAQKPQKPAGSQTPVTPPAAQQPDKKALTPAEITASLCGTYGSLPSSALKDSVVKSLYDVDFSKIESYSVKAPAMNVEAAELAVFKVADAADASAVKSALEARVAAVQQTFEQYDPQQYEIAKKAQVVTSGNYILLAISSDASDVAATFRSLLK